MSEREIIGDEVREVIGTRSYRNWYIIVRILAFTVCGRWDATGTF